MVEFRSGVTLCVIVSVGFEFDHSKLSMDELIIRNDVIIIFLKYC